MLVHEQQLFRIPSEMNDEQAVYWTPPQWQCMLFCAVFPDLINMFL